MSGWLQKWIFDPGGVAQTITIDHEGLDLSASQSEDRGLYFRIYVGVAPLGAADVAIEAAVNGSFGGGYLYGRKIVGAKDLEPDPDYSNHDRFKTAQTFNLYVEGTHALDVGPPSPPFTNPDASQLFGTLTLTSAAVPASGYTVYYLEWWGNMVNDFGKKVKVELNAGSWDNAGAPDAVYLMLDGDTEREDITAALGTSLVLVHGVTEASPESGFEGGFGRKGRKLVCIVTAMVRGAEGVNASKELKALETLELFMEDIMQIFDPAGVPNLLDDYCYFTKTEPEGGEVYVPLVGVNAVARSVRISGYKIEAR